MRDAGVELPQGRPLPATDFFGGLVPQGAGYDIGAFELP